MNKVVTFYSFKGGAGRTVCAANIAHLLAKERQATRENPLLLLDMDLDSAGLTIMLEHFETYRDAKCSSTKVATGDFQTHTMNGRQVFLQSLQDISKDVTTPGSVLFLGASFPDQEEFVLEAAGAIRNNMKNMVRVCDREGIGTIVIDSAAGRQEIAQVCQDVSQVIVYCCRITRQFIEGTSWDIQNFMKRKRGKAPKVILYPVAVPVSKDEGAWKLIYDRAIQKLQIMANTVKRDGGAEAIVVEPLGEVESFKWEETILVRKQHPTNDELGALASYSNLVKEIANFLQ